MLDSQYIIAGLIPTIIIGFSAAAVYFGVKGIHIDDPNLRWATNAYLKLCRIFFVAVAFAVALDWLLSIGGFPFFHNIVDRYVVQSLPSPTTWGYALIMLLIYIVFLVFFVLLFGDISSGGSRFFSVLNSPIAISILTIPFISFYILYVYSNIPYSLGGAKSRCAYLDVDISKVSADSRSALFSINEDTATIRRSDAVDVYYAGDNWVLVKKAAEKAPTYEIDRDAINAIIWC